VLLLARKGADPIAHTGLLSAYSYALIVSGRYEEGLKSIEVLTSEAENYGIEFPIPYARLYRAKALVGLRKFAPAARIFSTLERYMHDEPGTYFHGNLPVERARLYASLRDLERALDCLSLGPHEGSVKGSRGQFLGLQALLLAIVGDSDRAAVLAAEARHATRDVEAKTLSLLTEAIVALNGKKHDAASTHLQTAIETGVWDPVVIAVRATPQLGAFIAEQPRWRSWLQRLLAASRDTSLASSIGLRIPREAKCTAGLSPRETEVHELLAQGLTNEKIAKLLYISLSTTKVHVKHIYEKLGVRSRLEAARALRDDV
jgi:ATP/maltotriose-dependent transcriptional regulator MalT